MPLLDGKKVPADEIDPAKHRYVGMWRPPSPPYPADDEAFRQFYNQLPDPAALEKKPEDIYAFRRGALLAWSELTERQKEPDG